MYFANYSLRLSLRRLPTLTKNDRFLILRKTISTTPIKSDIFNIGKRMRHENFYKQLDKVDLGYELIYRAPFEYLTSLCKHIPTFALGSVSSIIAYRVACGSNIMDMSGTFSVGPTMSDGTELLAFSIGFYIFNLTLLYATTRYPLRIYKLKNDYIAMFEGYLPFLPRKFNFRKGDVLENKRSILPWNGSMYKIRNKPVIMFSHHFKRPADFNDMLKQKS